MIAKPETIDRICSEAELLDELHRLDHQAILELGCGAAELTRIIAGGGPGRRILALEVDRIQHARNLEITDLPNVRFALGAAEVIPADDQSFGVAFMFKSLHHVPVELMDQALRELHRVLLPGGRAHVSEPIYAGAFNDVLRLFHDEGEVRAAAFQAIERAVRSGLFSSGGQHFYLAPVCFADFAAFEAKVIGATHTAHDLSPELHAAVRARFSTYLGADGARFLNPMRIDLLIKPG
jgi:SAM-dependent methyltransferase